MSRLQLTDRVAAVTGAASGIGLAIAKRFAQHGAALHLLDFDAAGLQHAAGVIVGNRHSPVQHVCDVSSESSVSLAFATIQKPVILVNCAGVAHVGDLSSTTPEDLDRLFSINVRGTYLCMRAVIDKMVIAGGGTILNIASVAATRGISDRFAYSMSKGAVLSMTLSVAKDYIRRGVRCNCISPARVHTPFVDGFIAKNYPGEEAERLKSLAESQPIGRMAEPDEVASLAHFLCSDEAAFITGVDVPMDGGFLNLR